MSDSPANTKKTEHGKNAHQHHTPELDPTRLSSYDIVFRAANAARRSLMPASGRKDSFEKFLHVKDQTQNSKYTDETILFSEIIKKSKTDASHDYYHPALEFSYKLEGPQAQALPIADQSQRPGHVPISTAFHFQSNRERIDDDDDGLDEVDLTAVDATPRKPIIDGQAPAAPQPKARAIEERRASKRHSFIYEAIRIVKGDFIFPHRTYRPKVQVAYRVPPGQMPQAVVIERLHRLYIKADIERLCTSMGVTRYDLMPVPHYGETNERFYQEMQWRNRIRINGVDKREFLNRFIQAKTDAEAYNKKEQTLDTDSRESNDPRVTRRKKPRTLAGEDYVYPEYEGEDGEGRTYDDGSLFSVEDVAEEVPPPFGPMFPLDFFDNEEFDIRPGDEWMYLGWDWKDQKMYPIPGKAYLPIRTEMTKKQNESSGQNSSSKIDNKLPPTSATKKSDDKNLALSQLTAMNLLTQTPRLERFRKWLLEGRYRRLSPLDKQTDNPGDVELTAFARATTTVPNFMALSTEELNTDMAQDSNFEVEEDTSSTSAMDVRRLYSGDTKTLTQQESSEFDLGGNESNFLSQFTKNESIKTDKVEQVKEIKRSASLLTDIFSDPDSLTLSPQDSNNPTAVAGKDMKNMSTLTAEQQQSIDEFPDQSQFILDDSDLGLGLNAPNSPDIDPYEDGYEDLVFDYDKMRKVHNYDWKWVEVAVFKYDAQTRKYFVRTISPPIIFAWLSKLYIVMDAEDPHRHAERLRDAVKRRYEIENIMRYNLYVDCLPTERAKSIPANYMRNILEKILDTPKLNYQEQTIKRIQKEVDMEFKRVHLMLEFNHIVEKNPKLYQPWVKIPQPFFTLGNGSIEWKRLKARQVEKRSFTYKIARIQKLSVIYQLEPFEGLVEIVTLCLEAREKTFLLHRRNTPLYLDDFIKLQKTNTAEIMEYLKDEWMENVMAAIRKHLSKIPHSWYSITEGRWDVYHMSKTCKYLNLVKCIMEATLRFITESSILNFVTEIEDLTDQCDVDQTYDWGENLIQSEFPPGEGLTPPFLLSLFMDGDGPKYTQLLSKYPKLTIELFDFVVSTSSTLPDIVPKIMVNLLFGVNSQLNSVELQEAHVKKMKARLLRALRRGLFPVDRYAQKFKRYLSIWNLDLPNFLRKYESENHSAADVKKAVEFHTAELTKLEEQIPSSINIACFQIDVDVVKQSLIKKKKALINGMLEQFASKLHDAVYKIREDYQEMEKKLNTRSDDIAEVMELKMYVETVPMLVKSHSELLTKLMKDYEMFEKFSYGIPKEDFEAKWNAAIWSGKILKMADDAIAWLDEDYDRLLKVQQSDMVALSDAVDSAFMAVAGLTAFVEIERSVEVAAEVKKIWKQVKELIEQNILLNTRQKIFGLPDLQNEALDRLTRDIEPFKSLWFTAADWVKIQEVVFKETLDKIDMRLVMKLINEGSQIIRRCVRYFKGADAIQHIAEEVLHQIEEFKPIVPLITTLKNQGMRQRHWEAISEACGFTVVAKGNQNFKALLDQGMRKYVNEIAEIGNLATHEFSIETKLEKMQNDMAKLKIITAVEPTSGVVIIELVPPRGLLALLEAIQTTEELQENPYKTPFEERLNVWEKKAKMSRDNINLWHANQKDWIELQAPFTAPDAATRMPLEHKMFVKMERIWRRLNRLVRDKPEIVEIGSDSTVRASLLQFNGLIVKVQRGLEEFLKPQGSSSDDDEPDDGEEPGIDDAESKSEMTADESVKDKDGQSQTSRDS